ncbi:Ig-like domain-containing protein [Nocardioides sp. CN2-186]|uniref:Ig-like domain-containing protein n=1 Tax=Nocardioides tweenelious TaxID=3156607 RepID=UPI0032B39137
MISSGTKRGLAAAAVSAMAVAGLPFLASSASAAVDPAMQLAYVGPTRDAGTYGGLVIVKVKGISSSELATHTKVAGSNLTSSASNGNQTIGSPTLVGFESDDATNRFGGADGWDEAYYIVPVDTTSVGDSFAYALYDDVDGNGTAGTPDVDTNDQRVQVTGKTTGAPTSMAISPAKQTAPEGIDSGDYTLTLKDSSGNVTQLSGTEAVALSGSGGTTITETEDNATDNSTITGPEALNGTATFTANNADADLYTITAAASGFTSANATAQLDVTAAATGISESQIDIVTGKDAWDGFGGGPNYTLGDTVPVRVDQQSVTVNFKTTAANAGKTVIVNVSGNGGDVTFGGKDTKSFTTVLDSNGAGSITITPDAGTISTNDWMDITSPSVAGGDIAWIQWQNPSLDDVVTNADTYVSAYGGSVSVTAKAVDQFGDPISGVYLAVRRTGGANEDAAPGAKKATGADGTATFTLTDSKATAASHNPDVITIYSYSDPNAAPGNWDDSWSGGQVVYTADGMGADYTLYNDAFNTEAAAYDPSLNPILPLTDADANLATEYNQIGISGGTPGAPVSVSATNGALILKNGEELLKDASASDTGTIGDSFYVIGTKTGLTTVTVTSGGRTKTTTMLVKAATNNLSTARNVSVTGPDRILGGDTSTFVVTVTDAFGNPVPNRSVNDLAISVTGPASLQDSDTATDANGQLKLTVRADNDADSPIGVRVRALVDGDQFGALENNKLGTDAAGANTAPGLTASVQNALVSVTDVVNIAALQKAVDDAQAAVDLAQNNLDNAKGDLSVAKTEQKVAKKDVKQAKKALKKAKKHHKGVDNAKKNLNEAKGAKQIADSKVKAAQKKVDNAKETLAAKQADLAAAQKALEDAQSDS